MENEYLTTSSRFWLEDGIIKSRVLRPTVFTTDFAQESMQAMRALSGGKPFPRLAFMDGVMFVDRGARTIYAGSEVISALALVAESHDAQFVSEFSANTTEAPFPVGVFTTEAAAVEWLAAVAAREAQAQE